MSLRSPFLASLAFGTSVSVLSALAIYGLIGEFRASWVMDALRLLWVSGLGTLATAMTLGAVLKGVRWWLFPLSLGLQVLWTVFFIVFLYVGFNKAF